MYSEKKDLFMVTSTLCRSNIFTAQEHDDLRKETAFIKIASVGDISLQNENSTLNDELRGL
jgi:hypothetical protein